MAIVRYAPDALPAPWVGRARHWYDGDTLYISGCPFHTVVRIWGIDAPEWGQRGAGAARAALLTLSVRGPVIVTPHGLDKYRRIVATLQTYECPDIGLSLLKAGHVWWYHHFAPGETCYANAQAAARAAHKGLWFSFPYPFAPWVYRAQPHKGK